MTTVKNKTKLSEVRSNKKRAEKIRKEAEALVQKARLSERFRKRSEFKQKEFHLEVYPMTPRTAQEVLDNCNISYSVGQTVAQSKGTPTNRPRDAARVGKLKREILNGDWYFEHADVSFDTEGMLINGQHTLSAIVAANTGADVCLKTGCRPGSVQKIDVCRPRSVSSRLRFAGHFPMSEPDIKSRFRVGIASVITRSKQQSDGTPLKAQMLASSLLSYDSISLYNDEAIIDSHNEVAEGIEWLYENKTREPLFRRMYILAPIAMYWNKDRELAEKFYNNLISSEYRGKKSTRTNGVRALRRMILQEKKARDAGSPELMPKGMTGMDGKSIEKFWYRNVTNCIKCFDKGVTFKPNKQLKS